jgi:hypothetical protein
MEWPSRGFLGEIPSRAKRVFLSHFQFTAVPSGRTRTSRFYIAVIALNGKRAIF